MARYARTKQIVHVHEQPIKIRVSLVCWLGKRRQRSYSSSSPGKFFFLLNKTNCFTIKKKTKKRKVC